MNNDKKKIRNSVILGLSHFVCQGTSFNAYYMALYKAV